LFSVVTVRTAVFNIGIALSQGWANNGRRAKCGPPVRFQWSAEAFKKYVQT